MLTDTRSKAKHRTPTGKQNTNEYYTTLYLSEFSNINQ